MVLPSLRTFVWCPATVGKYSRLNDSFSFYLSAWKTSWPKSVMQWFAAVSYVCQNHSNRTKPFSHVPRHTKNPPHGMYINPSWECFPSTNAGGKKTLAFPKVDTRTVTRTLARTGHGTSTKTTRCDCSAGKVLSRRDVFFFCHQNWCFQAFPTDPWFSVGRSSGTLLSGFLRWQVFFLWGVDIIYRSNYYFLMVLTILLLRLFV